MDKIDYKTIYEKARLSAASEHGFDTTNQDVAKVVIQAVVKDIVAVLEDEAENNGQVQLYGVILDILERYDMEIQ